MGERVGSTSRGRIINIHIERLPEGVYLATSQDVQGLLAQGDTIEETIEIARDVARVLIEMDVEARVAPIANEFDLPVYVAA